MSCNNIDPYDILNIPRSSTDDEIKRAYRRLILLYHPDKNKQPDAADKFIEIQTAYDLLKSKSRRDHYDTQTQHDQYVIFKSLYKSLYSRYPDYVAHLVKSFYGSYDDFECDIDNMNIDNIYNHVIDKLPQYIETFKQNIMINNITIDTTLSQRFNDDQLYYQHNDETITIPAICETYSHNNCKFIINVVRDNVFQQIGVDIFATMTISLYDYLYGGSITLPYIDNHNHTIKFNGFINSAPYVEIDNLGMPYYINDNKLRGKLIILFNIANIHDPAFAEQVRNIS